MIPSTPSFAGFRQRLRRFSRPGGGARFLPDLAGRTPLALALAVSFGSVGHASLPPQDVTTEQIGEASTVDVLDVCAAVDDAGQVIAIWPAAEDGSCDERDAPR